MPVTFDEVPDSRKASGNSLSIKYLARGATSTFEIREAVLADATNFPPENGGLWINYPKLDIDQFSALDDHFMVTAHWEAPTKKSEQDKREDREAGDSHWELTSALTTVKITHSREAEILKTQGGSWEDTEDTIIGEDETTGEIIGADVPGEASEWRFTFYKPTNLITEDFVDQVAELYTKTNDLDFGPFEAGRLLLIHHRFSNDTENFLNTRCEYAFRVERERTATLEVFGEITVPPFWHLDVRYEKVKVSDDPVIYRKRPKYLKRHRLFDAGDYDILTATS